MTIPDLLEETYSSLTANKVRTGLTMLGIVIGIGSVIAMVSIGQGAQSAIQSSIQSIGSNLIIVTPGAMRGFGYGASSGRGNAQTLTLDDVSAISRLDGIAAVSPEVSGRYQIVSRGSNTNTSVWGVTPSYPQVRNIEIDEGNFITDMDVTSLNKVAVIGPAVLQDLFASGDATITPDQAIGQTIRIKNNQFRIIGVTRSKGGSGFGNQDDLVYVPLSTAQQLLTGSKLYVTELDIQAQDQQIMTELQNNVKNLLLERHNISDPTQADFSVLNQADIVATASSITDTLTILLGAIAGISLVVGGIGIMNMMLTTVTERTREIGLRKAIGAKNRDISTQFLSESVMLTFSGGVLGVIFGWLVASAVTQFAGIATSISPTSVLMAFGVSAVIGIVFGYYPARRAAGLNPIEALRYE
ncbi:FtsX-like permease family protein [bacterium]|nr:MAG: FtsX-like permease family protein [bacterium]